MTTVPPRIVIYAKDVQNITGRRPRAAQKMLQRIRRYYNKKRGDLITLGEFCSYTGMKREDVKEYLGD